MNVKEWLDDSAVFGQISNLADRLNIETYVVGGYVRDKFLGREGKKDIDFVCLGQGIELAEKLAEELGEGAHLNVYRNFGTAAIQFKGLALEFIGARKESYDRDSRKPVVEDGTIEDDENRRDFTINAMRISLNKASYGHLIDPFNGQQDLKSKTIRTPLEPELTFSDDPLRMLRAVRFACQLDFDIDPDTFEGIVKSAERIKIMSQERITDELNKIILSKKPSLGFKYLFSCGLLQIIFPDLVALQGVETMDGKGHKDNFYHTLQVLDNAAAQSEDLWLRWAAILHDIAKPATKRFSPKVGWTFHGHEELGSRWVPGIFKRFKLPLGENMRSVKNLVKLHLRPIALAKNGVTDSALRRLLFEAGPDLEHLMMLCRADITSKDPMRVRKYIANFDKVEQMLFEVEAKDQIRNFQPVITGEMIMHTFGLEPSKTVGDLKIAVREAILDNKLNNTFDEGYDFLITTADKMGLKPTIDKTATAAYLI